MSHILFNRDSLNSFRIKLRRNGFKIEAHVLQECNAGDSLRIQLIEYLKYHNCIFILNFRNDRYFTLELSKVHVRILIFLYFKVRYDILFAESFKTLPKLKCNEPGSALYCQDFLFLWANSFHERLRAKWLGFVEFVLFAPFVRLNAELLIRYLILKILANSN